MLGSSVVCDCHCVVVVGMLFVIVIVCCGNQDGNTVVVCYCHCLLVVIISILFTVGWPNPGFEN